MSNEQLPNEVWIFNNNVWRESWNYEETEILAHFKKAYDTKIHDHMTAYILATRVEKMIQLAVLEADQRWRRYIGGQGDRDAANEINQLQKELK